MSTDAGPSPCLDLPPSTSFAFTAPSVPDPLLSSASSMPPGPTPEQSLVALAKDHSLLQAELSRCKSELSRVSANCLTLENKLALGEYFIF